MTPNRLYLGTRKGLFTLQRSRKGSWSITDTHFLGVQIPMLLPDPRDGTLYVTADEGHFGTKLHCLPGDGSAWEERSPPVYPPKPPDVPDTLDAVKGQPVPWSLEKVWSLEPADFDTAGHLWAGTIPGGLFRSRDGARSWELISTLWDRPERGEWFGGGYDHPGIHSICVDPRDARHVLLGISCGGAWRTRDGGENWELAGQGMRADYMPPGQAENPNTQDPHRMVQCQGQPDHLWIQHHCAVYHSSDSGRSWKAKPNAKPSGFGFAVAVHPHDPLTAWFVPAIKDECRVPVDGRLVVSRTRDGGEHFEVLGSGLPDRHAYHLVYRHGLDVDPSGECLVMGSTTGGVWVSEDAGDHWVEVSGDLPPVYCVRWAP